MKPRWVLQMVGGVEGSTVAWAVRYYADGAALGTTEGGRRKGVRRPVSN